MCEPRLVKRSSSVITAKLTGAAHMFLSLGLVASAGCDTDRIERATSPARATIRPATANHTMAVSPVAVWAAETDSSLWSVLAERDSAAAIGLKTPGSAKGVERGRVLMSVPQWRAMIAKLVRQPGVEILAVDSVHLPVVRLKILDSDALSRIRRLPFVDYLEPALSDVTYASGGCVYSSSTGSSGSGSSSGGDNPFSEPLASIQSTNGIDKVSEKFLLMNIDRARRLSTGTGVTVGITDTGLDADAPSEFSGGNFSAGESSGRTLALWTTTGTMTPTCSHGTRISGLVGAPRNGQGVIGAAYKANIVSVYQDDGENPSVQAAALAIHIAATQGSKVVVMAWGELHWYDVISNEIDNHFYNDDVLFVGAAGTCILGSACPNFNSAVFPSMKEEVLSVTGAATDGSRPTNMYDYGAKSGVVAYTNLATTGLRTSTIVNLSGSSAATGVVGGVAALVRARYPSMTARQAMDQIIHTAGINCSAPSAWHDQMINAYAAVGGFCPLRMQGPRLVTFYSGESDTKDVTYYVTMSGGSGNYSVRWMTGETTTSITQSYHVSDAYLPQREVWVEVRDLGDSDPYQRTTAYVRVLDNTGQGGGGCTPVPPQFTCD